MDVRRNDPVRPNATLREYSVPARSCASSQTLRTGTQTLRTRPVLIDSNLERAELFRRSRRLNAGGNRAGRNLTGFKQALEVL